MRKCLPVMLLHFSRVWVPGSLCSPTASSDSHSALPAHQGLRAALSPYLPGPSCLRGSKDLGLFLGSPPSGPVLVLGFAVLATSSLLTLRWEHKRHKWKKQHACPGAACSPVLHRGEISSPFVPAHGGSATLGLAGGCVMMPDVAAVCPCTHGSE